MKRACIALVALSLSATGLLAQQADSASGAAAGRESGARAGVSLAAPILGGLVGGVVAGFGVTAFTWNPGAVEGATVGVGVALSALSARTRLGSGDHARINAQLEGRSAAYVNGYKEGYRSRLAQRRTRTALWLGIGGAAVGAVLTAVAVSGT